MRLYRRGATVSRVITLSGPIPEELEVTDLPLALGDASVRVMIEQVEPSGSDLVVREVRVGLWVPARSSGAEAPEAEALRSLEERIERTRHELAHVESEAAMLSRIEVPGRPRGEPGKPPPAAPTIGRVVLEELIDDATRSREAERATFERSLREDEVLRRDLEEKLTRVSSERVARPDELRKTVIARLERSGSPQTARVRLEYFVEAARWAPAYQLRLDRDGRADIELRALICQRTGEDWNGVSLSLSTAAPLRWSVLPELPSIRIGKAQPPAPRKAARTPPRGWVALYADYDGAASTLRALIPPARPTPAISIASLSVDQVAALTPAPRSPPTESFGEAAAEPFDDLEAEKSLAVEDRDEGASTMVASSLAELASPRRARGAGSAPSAKAAKARPVAEEVVEALLYAQLALPPAGESDRNRLIPIDRETSYREILGRTGVEVSGDIGSALSRAIEDRFAVESAAAPAGAADIATLSGDYDYAYVAEARVDVASDGVFHSVPLDVRTGPCDLRYVAVPREDPNVFRVASIRNPTDSPLLPGPAEVYVAGEFVLSTTLPSVPAGGEFSLGLGVEQAVRCVRNAFFREARSGDKVVATNELWHKLEIELRNGVARAIDCEVRERIPQPAPGAEVVVEEGAVVPTWSTYKQEERGAPIDGGRRWQVKIDPGGVVKLVAEYVVKIYANNELAGGNRREG